MAAYCIFVAIADDYAFTFQIVRIFQF